MAHTMTRRGRLEQSLAEAELALQFAELTPGVLPYAELAQAEALAWLGEFERSEEHCAAAERQAGEQWFARLWLTHVRGMRMLWQGDPHASDELLEAERVTGEAGVREPCVALWQAHAVAAHLASGRAADAQRVTEWLEECARPLPCRWPRIAAELGRALIAERAGADDVAHLHYGSALELFEHVDLPLQRIEALLWHGAFLRRQRHLLEARSRLAEALQLAERVAASWLAQAAHAELGLARGRRRRAAETRDGLTGAERRVVELAARGLSNREIAGQLVVSVNTVQTHLKHAYAKLGVSSRHQLRERVRAS
jgi:DNA-binding CsgD family transcriptional regulator